MIRNFLRDLRLRYRTSGLDAVFSPRKPRHPLLRLAFGLIGLALLVLLLAIGAVIGTAMLLAGLLLRLARRRGRPVTGARGRRGSLEGEFRVVERPLLR